MFEQVLLSKIKPRSGDVHVALTKIKRDHACVVRTDDGNFELVSGEKYIAFAEEHDKDSILVEILEPVA
jgi:hypothetical protein